MDTVCVTGGAGYIGSHACTELLDAGCRVVVIDNLANSSREAIVRVEEITGKKIAFYPADLRDQPRLEEIFSHERIDSGMHFAGLKAVGESVEMPLRYYHNNVTGTLLLCKTMKKHGVKNIIFSSSATVYGDPDKVPIREDAPLHPSNPYGRSKLIVEMLLRDLHESDGEWNIIILRYFNPVGAHPSGRIGEDPGGVPNNLVPFIAQVAVGRREELSVWGNDYPTRDGTGVRDYIHVVDLVKGHLSALVKLRENPGLAVYNLGRGEGFSVLEMVRAFEEASGKTIPCRMADRRPGDIAECFADPLKAEKEMGWKAEKSIQEMCEDTWRWQSRNPDGYAR